MTKYQEYGNPNEYNTFSISGNEIVGVQKNSQGDIQKFKLADGTVLGYDEAVSKVQSGDSQGLIAQKGNQGQMILRSKPDAHEGNNLDSLPTFE